MKTTLIFVLFASSALASELAVPVGGRTALPSAKAIQQIVVRDPSLVRVVVTDGAVSLEGKKDGVTAVMVETADRQLERMLVVVGEGNNAAGMSAERALTVSVKKSPKAWAAIEKSPAKRKL